MGLERLAAIMQQVPTNFDTDLIKPIIDKTAALAGISYGVEETDISLKVIADHPGGGLPWLPMDLPSNEGRAMFCAACSAVLCGMGNFWY